MAGLTYPTYINTMQSMLVIPQDNVDTNFQNIIPRMIEYAELRMYRELDFLNTNTSTTTTLITNNRNISIPGSILVVQEVNVITPPSQSTPDNGTRNPLERVSLDFLNAVYGNTTTGLPVKYALLSDTSVKLGPAPDDNYTAEFVGIIRPAPLSQTNQATYLSTNLPDMFVAASMIFGAGYQQNFGAQADNPQSAMSWEATYQSLKQGVQLEDLRQKAQSASWSNYTPSPIANAPRERASQ